MHDTDRLLLLLYSNTNSYEKEEDFGIDSKVHWEGAHSPLSRFELERVKPIKLAYELRIDQMAGPITASAFKGLCQYASSSGNRACYVELALSSIAVVEIIASTQYAYPWRDGQAE